jgi:hypothetical protein
MHSGAGNRGIHKIDTTHTHILEGQKRGVKGVLYIHCGCAGHAGHRAVLAAFELVVNTHTHTLGK